MNQLIRKLSEYYKENGLNVTVDGQKRCLKLKQRILVPDGFLSLHIFVTADELDYKKYRFSCYGLGNLKNVTEKDLFVIEQFNENQDEVRLSLDDKERVVLFFDKEFYDITSYDLGLETMGEALRCVAVFDPFIKNNYQTLKHIIKRLR